MPRYKYHVHYGDCTSFHTCFSWREAARFIKHLLDSDTRVREVIKEKYSAKKES